MLRELLQTTSVLGGQKIEGVVVKSYLRFDKKALMAKFVSPDAPTLDPRGILLAEIERLR